MEISYIKSIMLEDVDNIVKLLYYYKFDNIKQTKSEIRCSHDRDSNSTSVRIRLVEGLPSTDFSRNIKGDIFTLIMTTRNEKLFNVINNVKNIFGIDGGKEFKQRKPIFGGVYEGIRKRKNNINDYKVYDISILEIYNNGLNTRFLKDGISLRTQKKFNIGFDNDTQRITVPWTSYSGEIIGIMGRHNVDCETNYKWFPIIPFSKSNTLYGFSENYNEIINNDDIFIGESEKFVMQLDTMGYNNCVALGGNAISEMQVKQIISTMPKNIIFCYDEGLDFDIIYSHCCFCHDLCSKFGINVGYVYDINGDILKHGTKNSPSDLGKECFDKLIKNYVSFL